MPEYFETGSKKPGRGMAQRSLDLIEAMREIAKPLQPITGRGIGYQLFTRKLIDSMARSEMARVYRLLKEARERGIIPWSWIVDETRSIERVSTWDNPVDYARTVAQSYRRDFWNQQPHLMSAITIRAASTCQSATSPTGSPSMTAITPSSDALRCVPSTCPG